MKEFFIQAKDVGFDFLIVIAGIGIFLYGVSLVGDQLKILTGSKTKEIIDRFTTNHIKGVFVGISVTALMQSSSAVTALAISLVRSNLMTLNQAIGIFMGSNIGTTVTAILIGFNVGKLAPYAIVVGAFMELFSNDRRNKNIARLIFGFGGLFYGLELMGGGLKVLAEMPLFETLAISLSDNMLYSILLGIVMTVLIQSSSATIGILQTLYGQNMLTMSAALPMLFGSNIGTTITAVLSSLGGSKEAKKSAFAHIFFNVFGTTLFILILPMYQNLIISISSFFNLNKMMQIAFAHFTFNFITTIILLPFINSIEKLANLAIKGSDIKEYAVKTIFEESIISEAPVVALEISTNGTLEMVEYCQEIFKNTRCYIETKNVDCKDSALSYEDLVNELNSRLSVYLVDISAENLSVYNNHFLNFLIYSIKDLERIGDHLINIVRHFDSIYEVNEELTEYGKQELFEMMNAIEVILEEVYLAIKKPSMYHVDRLYQMEDNINEIERLARKDFIDRLKSKVDMGNLVMALYVDILSDFERVGDYSFNIAKRLKDSVIN